MISTKHAFSRKNIKTLSIDFETRQVTKNNNIRNQIFAAGFYSNIGFFTTATTTKPSSSNSFLTYENNCTLGIKIQYPANWQRDSYNNKVAFFAPSLDNPKIIPNTKYTI
jgi:hypothetical protein